jgi:polyphosphate kinase
VPANRPRWVPLPDHAGWVPLEQVIAHNLSVLFPRASELACSFFRVTRGAKDDPWTDQAAGEDADLSPGAIIEMVTAELTARKYAGVVRLEVSAGMPERLRDWLAAQLGADPADVTATPGLLSLGDLMELPVEGHPGQRDPPHKPVTHPRLRTLDNTGPAAVFEEIRRGDILVHLPYHSFDTSILQFIQAAAADAAVLAIKVTIYRTGRRSPIIEALKDAARRGKQVAVLVEITARFDEAPNISWGKELEQAGAHVAYGVERVKTHVKLALVVRQEPDGLRRYVHIGTGNYHEGTARLYEDLGLLSADPELAAHAAAVFNELTAGIPAPTPGKLLVAPHDLRERFTALIRREAGHARAGRRCGIHAKMNQLQDPQMIHELYQASLAGVPIALNVRGLCCLRAGVPGLSPTIGVYSTLGRFLEHSRIHRFENGGAPEYFIGSADLMTRNLSRRMETIAPICDPAITAELETILRTYEQDNCTAWDMQPDGHYLRRHPAAGEPRRAAQKVFIERAASS